MSTSAGYDNAPELSKNLLTCRCAIPALLADRTHEECWYVVYTRTRHEKRVAEQCREHDITAFLPLYRVQHRWKQRRAEVVVPLFPSYVFVYIALANRLRVLGLSGVVSLVSFNGAPAAIPEQQIDLLKKAITLGTAEPYLYLHSGKRVRVTTGPLIGLEGIVREIKNRVQVIVSFQWMARSIAISLDPAEVEILP